MGTDWSTTADYSFSEQDLWASKITSISDTADFKVVAETPSELDLTPEQFDITPEQIQSDNDAWAPVSDNEAAKGLGGWATQVYTGGTENS
jgi:hypothetical protein